MIERLTNEQLFREQAAKDGVTHFATGVAIFRDGKLLVVRRLPEDSFGGQYEIPGGGVDEGETFTEGAARETLEETGLRVSGVTGQFEGLDYQTDGKPKVRQLNYKVEVEQGEVRLEPSEHDDYKWISEADIDTLSTSPEMAQCLRNAFH